MRGKACSCHFYVFFMLLEAVLVLIYSLELHGNVAIMSIESALYVATHMISSSFCCVLTEVRDFILYFTDTLRRLKLGRTELSRIIFTISIHP